MEKLRALVLKLLSIPILRYLVMAVFCVCFELGTFILVNTVLGLSYLIATPISMAVGIVLNWVLSRKYVFKGSKYKSHVEFTLVAAASLVGAGIQLIVISIFVEHLKLPAIVGKLVAIMITFFWNFWFRKRFVFHNHTNKIEEIAP